MNNYIVVFLIAIFISSVSQIILKISANKKHKKVVNEIINPLVIFAYALFFISMILSTLTLPKIEYKITPVLECVGYIYILILSHIILKERITRNKLIGNLIIIVGIIIYTI